MSEDEHSNDSDTHRTRAEETKRLARVLKVIFLILAQPGQWKRVGLATYFEVSERAIDRDLQMIRGQGYEINRASGGGYSFARTPPALTVSLSLPEIVTLMLVADLAQARGDIDTQILRSALAQLSMHTPHTLRPLINESLARMSAVAESASHDRTATLAEVHQAWTSRRRVSMTYATGSRGGTVSTRIINIYAIQSYDRSWMIDAYDDQRRAVRTFKLDRIQNVAVLEERYEIPSSYQPSASMEWGILRGLASEPIDVQLLFDSESGRWVREERRQPRFFFCDLPDGHVRATITVGVTPEFIRWILGWGTHCRVEEPAALREQVRQLAEETARHNHDDPSV